MALMDWIKNMEDIELMEMVASKAVFMVVNDLLDMKGENQDFKQKQTSLPKQTTERIILH